MPLLTYSYSKERRKSRLSCNVDCTMLNGNLRIHWTVEEEVTRAAIRKDGDKTWEDSCVELFIQDPLAKDHYYNIECTALGYILIQRGTSRTDRRGITARKRQHIEVHPTFKEPGTYELFELPDWKLELYIKPEFFGYNPEEDLSKIEWYGNIYKCGDKLPTPHWLSLFPIKTEKPDFHRPDSFKRLYFI